MEQERADWEDLTLDNDEDASEISSFNPSEIVVYSRDWTIETIFNQIKLGNIDLNPKFQRRNAWNDEKRSKLIESIIMSYPIPEIVLAEDPNKKKSFIVIDGKQRLLTIAGFIENDSYRYWDIPKLRKLTVLNKLNQISYEKLRTESEFADVFREFNNSSLRCTVITNFTQTDVLYDIFYRLNSGSVALATQELRQVLNRGKFADYLIEVTNTMSPIHQVLSLSEPDKRLKDVEIILRIIAFRLYANEYTGNLKKFLDDKMEFITRNWNELEENIHEIYNEINLTITYLSEIFGGHQNVGRKVTGDLFESRFNKVVFEIQLFYFMQLDKSSLVNAEIFVQAFKDLSSNDAYFRSSIESSTKNLDNYKIRYSKFEEIINRSFNMQICINPFR